MKAIKKSLVILLGMLAMVVVSGCSESEKLEVNIYYKGEVRLNRLGYYDVKINDSVAQKNGIWICVVQLESNDKNNPITIIGHDHGGDGQFDSIFIRNKDNMDGYNAILFTYKGKQSWKPCPTDMDKTPPSDKQIAEAQALLHLALATVHDKQHIVMMFKTFHGK